MPALEVHIRSKTYEGTGVCALRDMDFSAAQGEFLVIVGPSGAGKSTLLNIIAGLDTRLDGAVSLHTPRCATRLGFMFQDPRLMPWLTVLDNLRLVMGDSPAASEAARRLLAEVGLGDFEAAFPRQLSGGMQRRVALARAFAGRPNVLLMDEPFLSLDAPTAARLRGLLLELWHRTGSTIIFVTHALREALALGDRVLFLSGSPGHIVLSLPVTLPRPRDPEDPEVCELHARLLAQHPELLSGLTGDRPLQAEGPATPMEEL